MLFPSLNVQQQHIAVGGLLEAAFRMTTPFVSCGLDAILVPTSVTRRDGYDPVTGIVDCCARATAARILAESTRPNRTLRDRLSVQVVGTYGLKSANAPKSECKPPTSEAPSHQFGFYQSQVPARLSIASARQYCRGRAYLRRNSKAKSDPLRCPA